jgi:hypothetical protein
MAFPVCIVEQGEQAIAGIGSLTKDLRRFALGASAAKERIDWIPSHLNTNVKGTQSIVTSTMYYLAWEVYFTQEV